MIELDNVSFSYPDGTTILNHVSMTFEEGSFSLIKGRSGTGKSSLLRLMNRLEDPREGEMRYKGRAFSAYDPEVIRSTILYIQQTHMVISGSVKNNLMLPFTFKINRKKTRPDENTLLKLMDEFHLGNIGLDASAGQLSVGQAQRLCLIRGLLLSPEVILLDEPTSALDDESCRIVESSVVRLCLESGKTVIMVNHRKFNSEEITPRTYKLADGGIREET